MSFFNFEILKGKPTKKSIRRMPQVKLSKNMLLGKKIEKKKKDIIHMEL
jgi:hypothetical protein